METEFNFKDKTTKKVNVNFDKTKFNLSEKLHGTEEGYNNIREEDVKEFIRLLKEEIGLNEEEKFMSSFVVKNWIEHLAGDKLLK